MAFAPQHVLSAARIVLGGLVYAQLVILVAPQWALPTVVLACASDFADGKLARGSGTNNWRGRIIDNGCDAGFLVLSLWGLAVVETWSLGLGAWRAGPIEALDSLPLIMLGGSFGSYALGGALSSWVDRPFSPSVRGHWAGIANYALVVVGAVEAHPRIDLAAWTLALMFGAAVLLNFVAFCENLWWLVGRPGASRPS